jgi:LmbE family N-acetylglucosaminyl deacetylase/SAM-dependent methyltransferase
VTDSDAEPAPVPTGSGQTATTRWSELRTLLPELPVPGTGHRLLVVAAHPDDETLGAGGMLAAAEARGAAITVLIATDGDASHPRSPTHSPRDLAHLRRREVYAALAALAPSADVQLLGLPDGHLAEHLDELTTHVTRHGGECTHIVTPWVGDRHPDHEACARAAEHAVAASGAKHWQYPIWAWHWGDPAAPDLPQAALRTITLDPAARAAKERAIWCYPSQCAPLSDQPGDEAVLSPGMLAHFRTDSETFVVTASPDIASPDYFSQVYAESADPWGLERRFYERRKRETVLAALTRERFRRAFEPGCATGLLTAELARRCDEVVAWDVAQAAVDAARERLAGAAQVCVTRGQIPTEWPEGRFDLIVLSEVGYYCPDLGELARRVDQSLDDDGVLVACHWRPPAPLHPHTAGAVHGALGAGRRVVVSHVEADFLLHVWTRTGTSVAAAEGLVVP